MSNFPDEIQQAHIKMLISQLYQEAEVAIPNLHRRITPLGELIGAFNLANQELPGLSQQLAMSYLRKQGVLVENLEAFGQDALAGFLYANTLDGCIFVEANDHLTRRRFSVAHELGHYLLHFRPLLEKAERDQEYLELTDTLSSNEHDDEQEAAHDQIEKKTTLLTEELKEYEADQFATELLMPETIIRRLFARVMLRFRDDDLVSYLATEMLVSQTAMRRRLRDLHLLPVPGSKPEREKETE